MRARHERNLGVLTAEEQQTLGQKRVFIAGCGGLGGYSAEFMARVGVGGLVLCDADHFEESNLNRQLFCTEKTLGQSKAHAAAARLKEIDGELAITAHHTTIREDNAADLIRGCDLVIDALDSLETRLLLERACAGEGIPYLFGGVNRTVGMVTTVLPGDDSLRKLFSGSRTQSKPSVLCFAVAAVSCHQAMEAVEILLGRPKLRGKLLVIDLLRSVTEIVPLKL
ncbi:MAG: HesA/MoeB/ThiF family protein [Clostridia bacterium]|nr:HesA/MoeB/ThiF family protein [Clostridia bacterium]